MNHFGLYVLHSFNFVELCYPVLHMKINKSYLVTKIMAVYVISVIKGGHRGAFVYLF